MRVFYPAKQIQEFFGTEETSKFRENRIKRKVVNTMIYSNHEGFDPSNFVMVKHKMMPNELKFSSVIEIWENKVLIASLEGHISALVIDNQEIATTMKSIFDLGYESALNEGIT